MKTLNSLLPFLLLLQLFFSSYSQWVPIDGPSTGGIFDLKQNDDYIFAATSHGVYRTDNEGLNWTQMIMDTPNQFLIYSIDVFQEKIIAHGYSDLGQSEYKLFKSENNGDSWTPINQPYPISLGTIAFNGSSIYINNSYNLWYSNDFGESWQNSILQDSIIGNSGVKAFGNQFFAGGKNKIYRSELGDDEWEIIPLNYPFDQNLDFVSAIQDSIYFVTGSSVSNGFNIYRSFDYGQSWDASDLDQINWQHELEYVTKIGDNFYANYYDRIAISLDNGETWFFNSSNPDIYPRTMIERNGNILMGSFFNGIQSTEDFGATYEDRNNGISAGKIQHTIIDNGILYAAPYYGGIFRYDLNQETWELENLISELSHGGNILIDNGNILYVNGAGDVLISDVNAISWSAIPPPDFIFSIHSQIRKWGDKIYHWVGSQANLILYATNDYGQNWEELNINIGGDFYYFTDIQFNSSSLFAVSHQNLIRSNDEGNSWEIINNNLDFSPIGTSQFSFGKVATYDDYLFVFLSDEHGNHRFYKSSDNGNTWDILPYNFPNSQPPYFGLGLFERVGDVLFLELNFAPGGIYVSQDFGLTWTPFNEGLKHDGILNLKSDGVNLFLGTDGQGVFKRPLTDLDFESVSGIVFNDENNNGVMESNENPIENIKIKASNNTLFTSSKADGFYEIFAPFLNQPQTFEVISPQPTNYYEINPPNYTLTEGESGKNFGVHLIPDIKDLKIDLTHFGVARPGFSSKYSIEYKNIGTEILSGYIEFILEDGAEFTNSIPTPTSINGNILTWDYSELELMESGSIEIDIYVPTSTVLGTEFLSTASIFPILNDESEENNIDTSKIIVVGSYDPNDKSVFPEGDIDIEKIEEGVTLTYTIRFQNTGTYLAETVRITDYLSSKFDLATFEIIDASHHYEYNLQTDGFLEFDFEMINLPDSTSNEMDSHGFIKYSIMPKKDLSLGAVIDNKAYIYFDFNQPIITNTVVTEVNDGTVGIFENNYKEEIKIFPNPSSGDFTLILDNTNQEQILLSIISLNGKILFEKKINDNNPINLNMKKYPSGIYFIRGIGKDKLYLGKMILKK